MRSWPQSNRIEWRWHHVLAKSNNIDSTLSLKCTIYIRTKVESETFWAVYIITEHLIRSNTNSSHWFSMQFTLPKSWSPAPFSLHPTISAWVPPVAADGDTKSELRESVQRQCHMSSWCVCAEPRCRAIPKLYHWFPPGGLVMILSWNTKMEYKLNHFKPIIATGNFCSTLASQ